ncbi:MAG TPA: condensation domain-containing protein, partial [Nitrospiraceae bacterium]|nr:condensation domain-containing protein [Nitrospiraceae bacterium]
MIVSELLARLEEKNLVLSLKGDELVIRGKRELLDGPLLKLLREHKQDLLESLRATQQNPAQAAIPADCSAITPEMLPLVALSADQIRRIESAVPGGARNIQDIYPLAPLQEGMLFHHLMVTQGDVFLVSEVLRFDTRERLLSLVDALQAVIDRHDILRTAVLWEGLAEPVQVVWRRALIKVEEVTLEAGKDEVAQLRARFDPRHYRIDVRQAPMMRLFIARESAGSRWLMLVSSHHLVSDRTTWELKQREIQAHLLGKASELPPPVPFRTFVAQTRRKGSQEEHEAFFRGMLADVDEPTAPFGLTNVHDDGAGTADGLVEIDVSLARTLRAQARIRRVSVATLFHLAWALVLARISGRDDVVFGTVLLGRLQGGAGVDRALGLFINTLPMRTRVGDQSVEQSLQEVHVLLAQLLRHENAPLALAQRCSAVIAPAPLFTTLLNYRHAA